MKSNKKLCVGTFHLVYDHSRSGHPGMIYWKNEENNLYLAITTSTSAGRHQTKLKFPTDNKTKISYVKNRPFLGKKKDFGSKVFEDMRFHEEDYDIIITISKRTPRCSDSISENDKIIFNDIKKAL